MTPINLRHTPRKRNPMSIFNKILIGIVIGFIAAPLLYYVVFEWFMLLN